MRLTALIAVLGLLCFFQAAAHCHTLREYYPLLPHEKEQQIVYDGSLLQDTTTFLLVENDDYEIVPETDSLNNATIGQRPGFFRRVGNYFKNSNTDKTAYKKFDFSIIGGPHYSSAEKLGLGVVAAGLYRLDRTDFSIPPSDVSVYGDISTSGFYLLGVRGNTYFKGDRHRLDYKVYFYSKPSKFWGIGYDAGRHNRESEYERRQTQMILNYMYRLTGDLFLGFNTTVNYTYGRNFHDPQYIAGYKDKYTNTGLGLFLVYDSRDSPTSAYTGWYVKLENVFFPKPFGNNPAFNKIELTVNKYHPVWKGGILAYDLHGVLNTGDVPWTMMAMTGGMFRMRGYYDGRYRDKGLAEFQMELRQRVWKRIGVAAWAGAGNVFPKISEFRFRETLPNYGVGVRWEFKNRVNVRFDYGLGRGTSGFIFNINEAF